MSDKLNRRDFLQAGAAVAGASSLTIGTVAQAKTADEPDKASKKTLPTRRLGKTGVDVTILNQGTWQASGLNRILRTAYDSGIRVGAALTHV